MTKNNRQLMILDVISGKPIHTLSTMVSELKKQKCTVDISTLSRDMAELKIVKTVAGYRVLDSGSPSETIAAQENMLRQLVTKVSAVNNLVVVGTISGGAMVAGRLIDLKQAGNLVGTVCGDDTIICVAENVQKARKFVSWLSDTIKPK